MQLRKTKPLGIFYDHEAGCGHIHADFNHRGGDQYVQLSCFTLPHYFFLILRLHSSVDQSDSVQREHVSQELHGFFRGLDLEVFRFLNQRANPIGLVSLLTNSCDPFDDLIASFIGQGHCSYRYPAGRQFINHG